MGVNLFQYKTGFLTYWKQKVEH